MRNHTRTHTHIYTNFYKHKWNENRQTDRGKRSCSCVRLRKRREAEVVMMIMMTMLLGADGNMWANTVSQSYVNKSKTKAIFGTNRGKVSKRWLGTLKKVNAQELVAWVDTVGWDSDRIYFGEARGLFIETNFGKHMHFSTFKDAIFLFRKFFSPSDTNYTFP